MDDQGEEISAMEMEMIIAQINSQDHSILPLRYKSAIKDMASDERLGSSVYLFLMMNDRINKLESKIKELEAKQ